MKSNSLKIKILVVLTAVLGLIPGCPSRKNSPKDAGPKWEQRVRVVARQFVWEITQAGPDGRLDTADDIRAVNEITLPENSRVTFELQSRDVVHGFWVPRLGIRQTLIPGATLRKEVVVGEPGQFKLACSELCGAWHAKMWGWVRVLPEKDFRDWQASKATGGKKGYQGKL